MSKDTFLGPIDIEDYFSVEQQSLHLEYLVSKFRLLMWQDVSISYTESHRCFVIKSEDGVVARIAYWVNQRQVIERIEVRTDLLAKFQPDFLEVLPRVPVTFSRFQPYLVRR